MKEKLGKLWYGYGKMVYKDTNTGKEYVKTKKGFQKIIPPVEDDY